MSRALTRHRRRPRRKRNPKGIRWGWLLYGAAAGAAYSLYNDTAGAGAKTKPTPTVIAYDALALSGVGLGLLGIAGGLLRGSTTTIAIGAIAGVAAFAGGTSLALNSAAQGA